MIYHNSLRVPLNVLYYDRVLVSMFWSAKDSQKAEYQHWTQRKTLS